MHGCVANSGARRSRPVPHVCLGNLNVAWLDGWWGGGLEIEESRAPCILNGLAVIGKDETYRGQVVRRMDFLRGYGPSRDCASARKAICKINRAGVGDLQPFRPMRALANPTRGLIATRRDSVWEMYTFIRSTMDVKLLRITPPVDCRGRRCMVNKSAQRDSIGFWRGIHRAQ